MNKNLFSKLNSFSAKILFFVVPVIFYMLKISLQADDLERLATIFFIVITTIVSMGKHSAINPLKQIHSFAYFGSLIGISLGFLFFFIYKNFLLFDVSYMRLLYFIATLSAMYNRLNNGHLNTTSYKIYTLLMIIFMVSGLSSTYILGTNIVFYIISSASTLKKS